MSTNEHEFRGPEQLTSLFRDQTWLITRLTEDNGSYQGYLADLIKVWEAADAQARQQIQAGQPPTALADCIRYALIHCTIVGNLGHPRAIPSVYSDTVDAAITTEQLINLAPNRNVEKPLSSLETIVTIKDPKQRASALLDHLEQMPEEGREPVIKAAIDSLLMIQKSYWDFHSNLWYYLKTYFTRERLAEYANLIFESSNEAARAWFISEIHKQFNTTLLSKALISAYSLHDPAVRTLTLHWLVDRTSGKQRTRVHQVMYRSVLKVSDPYHKSTILVDLIEKLQGKQRANLIYNAMRSIPLINDYSRGWRARDLMPYLTRAQRSRFLKQVVNMGGLMGRIEAYDDLWYRLPKRTRLEVIGLVLQVRELPKRAEYLAKFAQKLRGQPVYPEIIQYIVDTISTIRNEDYRHKAIQDVRKYVQDDAIEQVAKLPVKRLTPGIETLRGYRFAFAERDRQHIAYALGNLSAFMDDQRKTQAQSLMVDLALEIDFHDYVAEAIEGIAPYLDETYRNSALEGALLIENEWSLVWALSGLAPYLKGEQLDLCLREALNAIGSLDNDKEYNNDSWFTVDMIARMLPFLSGEIRERALRRGLAAAEKGDHTTYDARLRLLPYLDSAAQSELATKILGDLSSLSDDMAKSWTLSGIAAYLPVHQIMPAIQSARDLEDEYWRESALMVLIPHLPDAESVLEMAQALKGAYWRSGALIRHLPHLSGEAYTRTLKLAADAIEKIESPGYRMERRLDLIPFVEDAVSIQNKALQSMLDYLWAEKDHRRNNILVLCASNRYISEKLLPLDTLRAIAETVIQICLEWDWQRR